MIKLLLSLVSICATELVLTHIDDNFNAAIITVIGISAVAGIWYVPIIYGSYTAISDDDTNKVAVWLLYFFFFTVIYFNIE